MKENDIRSWKSLSGHLLISAFLGIQGKKNVSRETIEKIPVNSEKRKVRIFRAEIVWQ